MDKSYTKRKVQRDRNTRLWLCNKHITEHITGARI